MKPMPANHQDFLNHREIPRDAAVPSLSDAQITEITELVFAKPNPQKADVMFVLGASGGDWPAVANLFSRGLAQKILVNGKLGRDYQVEDKPLARLIQSELVKLGVPKEAILIQDQSSNTLEDVKFGQEVLTRHDIFPTAILFVSKAHHSGRALRTLKKFFPQTQLFSFTYDAVYDRVRVCRNSWWQHPAAKARVYGEYLRIQRYAARGDIAM